MRLSWGAWDFAFAWEFAFPVRSPGETAVGKELDHLNFKIL